MGPKPSTQGTRITIFWLIVCLAVVVDQATKAAVRFVLDNGAITRTLISGLFDLRLVHNTGAAFSLGEGATMFFIIVALAVLVGSLVYVWKTPELPFLLVVSIASVAGGGIGNMIDRIIDGAVTDFIATTFINFPVFNVADIFVTVGVAVTVIGILKMDDGDDGEPERA